MANFVHLHLHSQGSFAGMKQDGICKAKDIIRNAKEIGFNSIALTDHGNMVEIYNAYSAAKEYEIKLIPGMEIYHVYDVDIMRNKNKVDIDPILDVNGDSIKYGRFHLTLLAINNEGLRNLFYIHEVSWFKNFYYKPNVDFKLLHKHRNGIVCLTGCPNGMIPSSLRNFNKREAHNVTECLKDIFEDRLYVELQRIKIPEFDIVVPDLIELAKIHNIKTVATNDVHFIKREDYELHDMAICINKGLRLDDQTRKMKSCTETYLKTEEEMLEIFHDCTEAVYNTAEIADRCEVDFFSKLELTPKFQIPKSFCKSEDYTTNLINYFKKEVKEGFKRNFPKEKWTEEYYDRVKFEVQSIIDMKFCSYFLIVSDFIRYCRRSGIPVGCGRGSGGGSIVCRCLDIIDIDPIEHGLIFERFLNPGRKGSPPDIDTDVSYENRQKVIEYVRKKYGEHRVAVIGTTGTFKPRQAIKDVGRVLSIPLSVTEAISLSIPEDPKITFEKALKESPKFKSFYDRAQKPEDENDEKLQKLFNLAFQIEGNKRHISKHAAGVVIVPDEYTMADLLPMMADNKDKTVFTGLDMYEVESIGLLKMDFLGLKTLDRLDHTLKNSIGKNYEWLKKEANLEDPNVYKAIFEDAQTVGVFQFEKEGMRSAIRQIKADCFDDLTLIVAAMRPGPKEFIPLMADCKHGLKEIEYDHPDLKPILKNTYGVCLFQEQALEIFKTIGGFTLAEADLARRAIGKKKADEMAKLEGKFISQAIERGYSEELAKTLFEKINKFSEYAFNRSHAACYAMLAFHTAWCKTYYPAEYMAQCFNYEPFEKFKLFVEDCRRMGIRVLPPDVNKSKPLSSVEIDEDGKQCVRMGYRLIKNVGGTVDIHSKAPYTSIFNFAKEVVSIDSKSFESLIKCGAFDSMGLQRKDLLLNLNNLMSIKKKDIKFNNVIDFLEQSDGSDEELITFDVCEDSLKDIERMEWENDLLGYCFTTDFYTAYKKYFLKYDINSTISHILESDYIPESRFIGMVYSVKPYKKVFINKETKEKDSSLMIFAKIGDFSDQLEVGLFEDTLKKSAEKMGIPFSPDLIRKDDLVLITLNKKNDRIYTTEIKVIDRK